MGEMNSLEYAREWIIYAENDLSSAEYLLGKRPEPIEIICYHCQQSAEKCLKAFLITKDIPPPKIHDLISLYHLCEPFIPNISAILTHCEDLDPYGVQPRYPNELALTEQEMKEAIQDAKAIFGFLQPLIG